MGKTLESKIKNVVDKICTLRKDYLKRFRRNENQKIYLGRIPSLGIWFQYFLAEELFNGMHYTVLVDCPVTIKERRTALYPDILVIDNDKNTLKLKGVIDVKLDLGYINPEEFGLKIKKGAKPLYDRNSNKFLEKDNDFFNSDKFLYKLKDEYHRTRETAEVRIPSQKQVLKIAVVLMGHVNHHNRYDGYKKAMEDAGFKFLSILWDGDVRNPNDK